MRPSGKLDVITRERYLQKMRDTAVAMAAGRDLDTKPINAWAQRGLDKLASQGRLVSEQQYQDHRRGRILRPGDPVRYVGPDRIEQTDEGAYTRPQGQTGTVHAVARKGGELLITFRPDALAPVQRVVDLVVRTNTPGYFTLERVVVKLPVTPV